MLASLAGVAALVGVACTLTTVKYDDCTDSDACRAAFGVGYVCASSGLCEAQPVPGRVVGQYPDDLLTDTSSYGQHRIIGIVVDYSLATHQARADAALMAIEAADDEGGITDDAMNPGPLAAIVMTNEGDFDGDGLTQIDASVAAARALVETYGVRAIIGPPSSSAATAVFEDLATLPEAQRPLVISMSATSNSLTDLEPAATDAMPGLLWRTAPPDVVQASTIVADMLGRLLTSIAIVYESGPYGEGLAIAVQAGFEAGLGTVVDTFPFSSPSSLNAAIGDAGVLSVDEVLFISSQTDDSVTFINFANSAGFYDSKTLFLTDGAANADLISGTSGVMASLYDRVRGTRPAAPSGPVYQTFRASFNARNAPADADALSFTAHSYDAGWMVIYGMAWSAYQESSFTGRDLARGLRHLSAGTPRNVSVSAWPAIREDLRAGSSVDLTGASGDLDYDPMTEETTGPIEVWCIDPLAVPSPAIVPCP